MGCKSSSVILFRCMLHVSMRAMKILLKFHGKWNWKTVSVDRMVILWYNASEHQHPNIGVLLWELAASNPVSCYCAWESAIRLFKYFCPCHPHGTPGWSSEFPALPSIATIWKMNLQMEALLLFLSSSYSALYINNINLEEKVISSAKIKCWIPCSKGSSQSSR